jgi:hypothetical protein
MNRRVKELELMNYFFITHLSTFGSKLVLTLKIIDFEKVPLTKVINIYVMGGMNALKINLYSKCIDT